MLFVRSGVPNVDHVKNSYPIPGMQKWFLKYSVILVILKHPSFHGNADFVGKIISPFL